MPTRSLSKSNRSKTLSCLRIAIFFPPTYAPDWFVSLYTHSVIAGLERAGATCLSYRFDWANLKSIFWQVAQDRVDIGLTIIDRDAFDGLQICEALGIPHFCLCIDPAVFYPMQCRHPSAILSCIETSGKNFLATQFGFGKSFHLPHLLDLQTVQKYGNQLHAQPLPEVLLAASAFDHEYARERMRLHFPKRLAEVVEAAAEQILRSGTIGIAEAFCQVHGTPIDWTAPLSHVAIKFLEWYVRGKHRTELVKALDDRIPLRLVGGSFRHLNNKTWRQILGKKRSVRYSQSLKFSKLLELMARSQVVLNTAPGLPHGIHERILYGMCTGATVFTDATWQVSQTFQAGVELETYRYQEWELLNARLLDYLASPQKCREVGSAGQRKVVAAHTWKQGFEILIPQLRKYAQK